MAYLLDSNVWIAVLRGKDMAIAARVRGTDPAEIRLCSIVKAELIYGAHRSATPEKGVEEVGAILAGYTSAPLDDVAAAEYAKIRFDLESRGLTIGTHDYMIAAIALANDFTLVTRNTREFARVPGLRLENWQSP
jgi:tRNA(fMet)-specific endonuclease VapC